MKLSPSRKQNMIEINRKKSFPQSPDTSLLQLAARTALLQQGAPKDITLSLLLTDDTQIKSLNRDYRGIDAPTDVLSFEVRERDPETGLLYLGEIIISIPYAMRQAKKKGHSLNAEAQLLLVHGILHLLGYNHAEEEEKEKMWEAQTAILSKLNLAHIEI